MHDFAVCRLYTTAQINHASLKSELKVHNIEEYSMLVLSVMLVAGVVVYVLSCLLHPYVACGTCEGKGKHTGTLFTNATRPCHKCSGAGQKQRVGAD